MLRGAVARRYAQALYEIAQEKNALEAMEQELKGVAEAIEGTRELQKVLYHPQVLPGEKKNLLKALFTDKVSDETLNFLGLVVDKRRENYIAGIAAEFSVLANEARGKVAAEVTTAIEIDEKQKQELVKVASRMAGKEVEPTFGVDPSLIGGVVVRIGSKVIDGSIKTRLATIKSRLMSKTS
ncbi:ATP synthase F1 subcomplex delta subunit [Desulforamulus reducens MI-1]|uniref:ATP synthase subunit delta n=1 Tax=Desulforamulus reducens (strain ATCC BAA-1160 / DSM 100696 / MI-1) TaxID=349161 RepID=ATPD_DESRM|nr:F0F1 ATP synthase subunit delta [Desulforamulus reducens]A4J9A2.1 RecName: Full=ATP synthase subunit delta; AltName: Full=ATP synthase F(1) sector subunit delta; AltName: Full=F-type ATPase subunit delta; Short=F-ATPase subunit delta [Desulforamulus reducens MI-1]ABO51655.1 ATP synthase F1 subcomplex delta subunit [Desulforamulus reducens MI-1]